MSVGNRTLVGFVQVAQVGRVLPIAVRQCGQFESFNTGE
jgi:hypothetical protein